MPGFSDYDRWKLATPPEYEVNPEDEDRPDETQELIASLREERDQLRRLYEAAIAENAEAVAFGRKLDIWLNVTMELWRVVGKENLPPPMPDFMAPF